jgi:hypothetical protein
MLKNLSLFFLMLLSSLALQAQPSWITEAVPGAQKVGGGTLRFIGMKIYDAELWAKPGFDVNKFTEQPFVLKLTYARSLVGKLIAERSDKEIRQLGLADEMRRKVWLEQMIKLFPDVKQGDSLAAVYIPGKSLTMLRNDALLGEIGDPEFARAFVSIWLHPDTSAPDLRKALASNR